MAWFYNLLAGKPIPMAVKEKRGRLRNIISPAEKSPIPKTGKTHALNPDKQAI